MTSHCGSNKKTNHIKQSVNNFKSSIFCGTKGFLTFNLALLSYLEYSLYDYMLQEKSTHDDKQKKVRFACAEDTDGNFATQEIVKDKKGNSNQYSFFKSRAVFAMKRNTIPFIEMVTVVPFVCFALPAMIPSINLLQCALICAALMITTCFIVRTFNLCEKLVKQRTDYTEAQIKEEFSKDSIIYPIFNENRKHIQYNSPDHGHLLSEKNNNTSYLAAFLIFLLKILQSTIILSLAIVELLEAVPSFFVDMVYDKSFESTKSNLQRSGHLLYASARNIVPVLSKFDEPVAKFIGTPEACGGCISK